MAKVKRKVQPTSQTVEQKQAAPVEEQDVQMAIPVPVQNIEDSLMEISSEQ